MTSTVHHWFSVSIRWVAVFLLMVCGTDSARASAELRTVLAELVGELKKVLKENTSLAIGDFSGPPSIPTSAGPGVIQILTEELRKAGIEVKTRAKFGVRGAYRLAEVAALNPDDARLGIKVLAVDIEVTVEDSFGKPLGDFSFKRQVRGEATIFHMVGVPASITPKGNESTERERDKELREQLTDPKPEIKETLVRAKAGSPYAVEILVEEKARAVENKDGLPFVGINRGESYAVRLINDTDHEAAVQLRIDGLSMFAFSELRQPKVLRDGKDNPAKGEPLYNVVLVPAKKDGKPGTAVVRGWHINNKDTDKFLVTEYAKSAAATLKQTGSIGTITVTFQAAWEGNKAPLDEPGRKRGPGAGDATGRGDRIGQEYREVERTLGVIRDSISVRYTKPQEK